MANAGRILIIPKGDYNENSTYDNLDLVKYKGTSWLAKKTVTGIEPSAENSEYWQDVFELNLANNLTTEEEGYALDARQGKVLNEKIEGYISKGSYDVSGALKDIDTVGIYGYIDATSISDYPTTMSDYIAGIIFVSIYGNYKTYKITAVNTEGTITKSIDGFFITGLDNIVWGNPY